MRRGGHEQIINLGEERAKRLKRDGIHAFVNEVWDITCSRQEGLHIWNTIGRKERDVATAVITDGILKRALALRDQRPPYGLVKQIPSPAGQEQGYAVVKEVPSTFSVLELYMKHTLEQSAREEMAFLKITADEDPTSQDARNYNRFVKIVNFFNRNIRTGEDRELTPEEFALNDAGNIEVVMSGVLGILPEMSKIHLHKTTGSKGLKVIAARSLPLIRTFMKMDREVFLAVMDKARDVTGESPFDTGYFVLSDSLSFSPWMQTFVRAQEEVVAEPTNNRDLSVIKKLWDWHVAIAEKIYAQQQLKERRV